MMAGGALRLPLSGDTDRRPSPRYASGHRRYLGTTAAALRSRGGRTVTGTVVVPGPGPGGLSLRLLKFQVYAHRSDWHGYSEKSKKPTRAMSATLRGQ